MCILISVRTALEIELIRDSCQVVARVREALENAIAPGVIDTAMTSAPQHDALKATIPIGHPGQPEDIAYCALFLASDDSKHITGETIDVNGGLYMD